MKFKILVSIFALGFLLLSSSMKAQTVYITDSGKKYHAKNCSIVKTGKKGIDLAEAKKQGYEPCKACKVESEPKKETTPATKKEATTTGKKS
ncbi:MAG: hypothetical protein V4506_01430 [Bacteroidota bacterium]